MDPFTMFGLVASALSVAEIITRVGMGCRRLQMEFSGALEHIDSISQQTRTIDMAIREICSIFQQRPQTFPSSFESHLSDSISAIHTIAWQIQDHVLTVRTEAEASKSRARLRHLRKSTKVREWSATLVVQTQALMLLLQVAQLHSKDERELVLEKASSREVFETASSMSAEITISSSKLSRENAFTKFSFDSVLLDSRVYQRAFESSWIREVSNVLKVGDGANGDRPASYISLSSNSAIASEGDCANSFRSFDVSDSEQENINKPPIAEYSDSVPFNRRSLMLQTSANSSHEHKGISDLALPKVRYSTIDLTGPATRGGTGTYTVPKIKHRRPGHRSSSSDDIRLFTCWPTGGRKELEVFKQSRHKPIRHGTFFEVKDGEITIILPVARQLKRLRKRIYVLSEPSPQWLVLFLAFNLLFIVIESCLNIDGDTRAVARMLVSTIMAAFAI